MTGRPENSQPGTREAVLLLHEGTAPTPTPDFHDFLGHYLPGLAPFRRYLRRSAIATVA